MAGTENNSWKYLSRAFAVLGSLSVIYTAGLLMFGDRILPTAAAQTDRLMESRLNQIEQRFYMLESRLNRIEQDAITRRSPGVSQLPDTHTQEIALLQNEVTGLRVRLGEAECGLLHLDERTLPAARRLGSRSGSTSDKCRQDWAAPIYLSARP